MANSKFSGAGFATGQTLTSSSSIAGLEETGPGVYENRRWTQEEFFQTSVSNGVGFIKFIFTGGQDCSFNHNGLTVNGTAYNQSNGSYQIVADTGNATSSAGISFKTSSALTEKMSINETISSKVNHEFEEAIIDGSSQTGTNGQVLSSTGTGVAWVNASSSPSKTPQTLTQGTTTWAIGSGYNAILNNSTATTLSITGVVDGDTGTLIVNNSGGGTISWPTLSVWPGGNPPTLSTGTDIFSFIYVFPVYYWSYGQDFS